MIEVAMVLGLAARTGEPYHFDFARNFFADDAAEMKDREVLYASFAALEKGAASMASTGPTLLAALDGWSAAEEKFRTHDLYFFARSAVNTTEPHDDVTTQMRVKRRAATRAMRAKICAVPAAGLAPLIAAEPGLKTYEFFLKEAREECSRALSAEAQRIADEFQFAGDPAIYFQTVEALRAEPVRTAKGDLDPLKDEATLEADPDPAVRAAARHAQSAAYAQQKALFAHALGQIQRACQATAHLRRFKGCAEQQLAADELDQELMARWYDQIAAAKELQESAQKLVAAEPAAPPPTFTLAQATDLLLRAMAPLGREYVEELSALLDPRNGRIDVLGGPNRLPLQGTSSVHPIGTSIFYARRFEGQYIDLMLLAHESGHAVQAMMMHRHGVKMLNGSGAAYMTESFGRFNELLAAEYLARTETDPARKAFFRAKLAERALGGLFGSATEGAVELAILGSVTAGRADRRGGVLGVDEEDGGTVLVAFREPGRCTDVDAGGDVLLLPAAQREQRGVGDLLARALEPVPAGPGAVPGGLPETIPERVRRAERGAAEAAPSEELLKRFVAVDVRSPALVAEALDALGALLDPFALRLRQRR